MSEVVVLGIIIAVLALAVLAMGMLCGYMAYRVRTLHEEIHLHRNATDSARKEYKQSYVEQGTAMQQLTREAVAAITTITHMMESVIKGTERGASELSVDFSKLEGRIESWMVTISQILSRLETKTNIYNTQAGVSGGQNNIGKTDIQGNQGQQS